MIINDWTTSPTGIPDCLEVATRRSGDDRGCFTEGYVAGVLPHFECRQSNIVHNRYNPGRGNRRILRGIHGSPFGKLVTCPQGQVYDVCVDLRPWSDTYGEWHGTWLYASKALYTPPYCGHAYMVGPGDSLVVYYQGDVWDPEREVAVNPLDEGIGIWWPVVGDVEFIMSDKDRNAVNLDKIDPFKCMTG